MTPRDYLVTVLSIDAALLAIAIYAFFFIRRLKARCRQLHFDKRAAQHKFRQVQLSLMDSCDKLRDKLDKAEAERDQAKAETQYNDKVISNLCMHYKKLEISHADLRTRHNSLISQYNSLLSKMPSEGDMPV